LNQSIRRIHSKAEIEFDVHGDAKRLLGTVQDIAKCKTVESRAEEHKALCETFMENLPALAYMKEMAGRLLFATENAFLDEKFCKKKRGSETRQL
jgi:hypothetical protein